MDNTAENMDRIIWGDYDSGEIIVTRSGAVGISVGGHVFVKTLAEWHDLAKRSYEAEVQHAQRKGDLR